MTRDVASRFNNLYGETFVLPSPKINEETKYVIGTNGQKMSKSKGNTINIFLPEKDLKKQIMSIDTDSTPLEQPKDYKNCNVFKIFSLIADDESKNIMKENYLNGGYGYGHAKNDLLNYILTHFNDERNKFSYYMKQKEVDSILNLGSQKVAVVANDVISRVRQKINYN